MRHQQRASMSHAQTGNDSAAARLDHSRAVHHVLLPQPRPRAQVSALLRACGRAELALRRRCAGCRSGGAAPRAKVLSWPLVPWRASARLLWSTSGPKGPRRRKRRRVPANPGRRAGDAARETAAERAVGRAAGDLPPRPPPEASRSHLAPCTMDRWALPNPNPNPNPTPNPIPIPIPKGKGGKACFAADLFHCRRVVCAVLRCRRFIQ